MRRLVGGSPAKTSPAPAGPSAPAKSRRAEGLGTLSASSRNEAEAFLAGSAHEERKAATQRANELGAKVDAVLKELRHATKKSGWGQLTQ